MSLVIRNARVIDPANGRDETADIAIRSGRVAAIGKKLAEGADEIDASELIACPGLIDPHVHLREPGQTAKEDLKSGTRAAVAGGFTTVCCMPNTQPPLDTPELIEWVRFKSQAVGSCRVFPVAAATKGRRGERMAEVGLCAKAGAVGVSDDGDVVASAGMMSQVLRASREAGLAFMQHCQEPTLTNGSVMHAGAVSARLGLIGWPREAEEVIIERDIRLNRGVGCHYHVQHISSGGSVEIIARARAAGEPVTAEVSPHHLTLTHEACAWPDGHSLNTDAKMNPPLREQADIDAIIGGVIQGVITVLATDHAPHTAEEKSQPFESAPFGIVGLESALGVYIQALLQPGHISWPKLIQMMTINPAKLCGLDSSRRGAEGLGTLTPGSPADVTLIDPNAEWTFSGADFAGRSRNSPFVGRVLRGRAIGTIVSGRVRYSLEDRVVRRKG